ncbi:winged helix-turn-helix transcriptional regulator [Streptomyces sp. TRM68367]|nr:winged helix-turn-helix transcriptional regulator [Streptomyces sp. TRM68367]
MVNLRPWRSPYSSHHCRPRRRCGRRGPGTRGRWPRRELPGVTEKVLASHLREMEADGLVHREVYDEVPPRVEYSLTDRGSRSTRRWSRSLRGARRMSSGGRRRPRAQRLPVRWAKTTTLPW